MPHQELYNRFDTTDFGTQNTRSSLLNTCLGSTLTGVLRLKLENEKCITVLIPTISCSLCYEKPM